MKHVFLSYSRRDRDLMRRVREALIAEGYSVWTDEKLEPGSPQWMMDVGQAIMDAYCVLVLLSPDSCVSQWVAKEISYAQTQRKHLLPVLGRGDVEQSVPFSLSGSQLVDIRTRFLANMQIAVDHLQELVTEVAEEADDSSQTPEKSNSAPATEREQQMYKFWESLLQRSKTKSNIFKNNRPRYRPWLLMSGGKTGISFNYIINAEASRIELYIDTDSKERNKAIFENYFGDKDGIEAEFGGELEWLRLDDNRASKIVKNYYMGGLDDTKKWTEIQDAMIGGMVKLHNIFHPRIRLIK